MGINISRAGSFLVRVPTSPLNPHKSFMINSYWDLYVAYIDKCVKENKERDIDPHHYSMEWNHFLPKCLFGDQPVGHYLTLKQHAIASALQTLAFEHKCLCGWHKKYLHQPLLDLVWKFYVESGRKIGQENARLSRGICDPAIHLLPHVVEAKRQNGVKVSTEFISSSLGLFDPRNKEKCLQGAIKAGLLAVEQRTGIHNPENRGIMLAASRYALENKKGVFDPVNKEKVRQGSKNSGRQAVINKKGIFSPDYKEKHSEVGKATMSQKWQSTVDGFVSNAGCVARHNKLNGWDPKDRIRIS